MEKRSVERPKLHKHPPQRKKRIVKKSWIEKNLTYIAIILGFLLMIQSFRGCIKTSTHSRENKVLIQNFDIKIAKKDSIIVLKDAQYGDLEELFDVAQDEIKNLGFELKIAGVKVDAAQSRADAIQRTADRIKQNTTITIEADTTRNKIK